MPASASLLAQSGVTTIHQSLSLVAGDDWDFDVTLGSNGTPVDITDATITWLLYDQNNYHILESADATVTITDGPAGKFSVSVPAAKTSPIVGSVYFDAFRIVLTKTMTALVGSINVMRDPWYVAPASFQQNPLV